MDKDRKERNDMALHVAQPGYVNAACRYSVREKEPAEVSYAEIACQLELALSFALDGKDEETVCEDGPRENEDKPRPKTITEEEWEELLEQLDIVEGVLQNMLDQDTNEQSEEENQERNGIDSVENGETCESPEESISSLTEESTWSFHGQKEEKINYITWYTRKEIRCKRVGGPKKDGWKINLFSNEEYEKILLFLKRFPEEWNLLFAAYPEFWMDFLSNDFDEDGFLNYFEGKQKNTDEALERVGNSEFLQSNRGRWAEYINPLGSGSAKRRYLHRICLTCEVECDRKKRLL